MFGVLIRASAKFRKHFRCEAENADLPVRPFPQTWNVDLIGNGRSQLIVLASEEYSLFTILIATGRGRDVNTFLEPFRLRVIELFESIGIYEADRPDLEQFTFAGRTDRKIIGSQNDMVYHARWGLCESIQPASAGALREIERNLNDMPMSLLGMGHPLKALWKKTQELKGA